MRVSGLFRKLPAVAATLVALAPHAQAQTPPDAGALRQQIEREQSTRLPRKTAPEVPAAPVPMRPVIGISVTVREFRFAGNTLISAKQLAPVVAAYLNRPLDFAQLQAAASAVASAYHEAGWIVRAYLPAQDIDDGIITIQIVEAVFGKLRLDYKLSLEGKAQARVGMDQVERMFGAQQKSGVVLNTDVIDRALLLADDLPGITVVGSLAEGTNEGETDLVLKLGAEPLLVGDAGLDNTGSRSTGANRVTANLSFNSPLGFGDLVSSSVIHTQGSDYLRLGATFPLGSNGWRIGANASGMSYKLIAPEFLALNGKGTSATYGLEASYPIIRARLKNLYFNAAADSKTFDNESAGATTTRYTVDSTTFGLTGNLFDNLAGGGANSASLSFTQGRLDLDGSANQAADAATTRSAGSFSKLRYAATRQQVITDSVSLFGSLTGQVASKNLDSSEKFYLGGSSGVRAYPASEGGGAEGALLTLELRWRLPEGFNLTAFQDSGSVTVNRNNDYTGAASPKVIALRGSGLSLAGQSSSGLNLKLTWARRQGRNPNSTASGNDQDGSHVIDRLWLTTSLPL